VLRAPRSCRAASTGVVTRRTLPIAALAAAWGTVALLVLSSPRAVAQQAPQVRPDPSGILTFEAAGTAGSLSGWKGHPSGPEGTLFLDSTVVHQGRYAGRIERRAGSPSSFSSFALAIPVDFSGKELELRGWLKLEDVTGFAGLWQRQDGPTSTVQFDNMQERNLHGTSDWSEYRVTLPLDPGAHSITVGALLVGEGTVWVDDLRLFLDGKPLADAPVVVRTPTVFETDHEFDAGSKIAIASATPVQVENLVLLGKVWGFLKYHHPSVVAGQRHWDYDLFRVLPRVLNARGRSAARTVLADWVGSLGAAPPCGSCAELPAGRPVVPRLAWLKDRALLGADLSARLVELYARRRPQSKQFFVSMQPAGNPAFSEQSYAGMHDPDAGYRLLALYRYWNIIEYWYPDRDVMEEDWDGVLREFVPRLLGAATGDEYATAMMALIARVHDTHANLWSSLALRPPRGRAEVPVVVRFVDAQVVVTGYAHARLGPASGLRVGDVIRAIDGVPVDSLSARWRPLYAASNEAARLRDIARSLTRGDSGPVRLTVERGGTTLDLDAERVLLDSLDARAGATDDHPGPAFRRLSDDVAYLKLSSVTSAETPDYLRRASGARCLVIDIRNYPSAFMVFALGQHLVKDTTPFAKFTMADLSNPGSFDWGPTVSLEPEAPWFEGGVAILVDETSQSQSEYTAMAFRARPGAVVVGSTTAGADGNVSAIPLPGGLYTMISGIGVFYPDQRPTQRIGIVPDVSVRPTIAAIRARRDEVLEAAIRRVLGREMTAAEYEALRTEATPEH